MTWRYASFMSASICSRSAGWLKASRTLTRSLSVDTVSSTVLNAGMPGETASGGGANLFSALPVSHAARAAKTPAAATATSTRTRCMASSPAATKKQNRALPGKQRARPGRTGTREHERGRAQVPDHAAQRVKQGDFVRPGAARAAAGRKLAQLGHLLPAHLAGVGGQNERARLAPRLLDR